MRFLLVLCSLCLSLLAGAAHGRDGALLAALAGGDSGTKLEALNAIAASGDSRWIPLLEALRAGEVRADETGRLYIAREGAVFDALQGVAVEPPPDELSSVTVNNRLRRAIGTAIAALQLRASDRETRLKAAQSLDRKDTSLLPVVERALAQEKDAQIRELLELVHAGMQLENEDPAVRLAAVKALGQSDDPGTRALLLARLDPGVESDEAVRAQAKASLREVEARLARGEYLGHIFSGVSLGSILLLAALGLAITYGLMGVINMAHGELIMIGAYATYVVQNLFQSLLPGLFDWYLLAALPVAFAASALVGMAMERSVIRFLYGRPLETLLATWGISLVLIQLVRTIFGAQNVTVSNPVWMSGGIQVMSNLVLPYNRVVIIGFAATVLLAVWLILTRTRLGLFVRGVTQNRAMAGCVGVPTARVDTYAFALGSGIAGLAGCALSQIGNVGPDLGQAYIVDSFMVVVLGGVGQLAGTVYAALGLGVVNKFLEAWQGAVLAKIAVLVFIIAFIQKRPQGLFALKGRFADA